MVSMLKTFLSYYKEHKVLVFLLVFGSFVSAGLELVFPMIVRNLLNNAIPKFDIAELKLWSIVLTILYLTNFGLTYLLQYHGHVLGVEIENAMRKNLFRHLQRMPFSFFDNNKTGQLLARLTSDIPEVSELAFRAPSDTIICMFSMLGTIGILFWLNPQLGAIVGVLLILKTIHTIFLNQQMKVSFRDVRARSGDVTAKAEESISGMRLSKAFAKENSEYAAFVKVSDLYVIAKKRSMRVLAYFMGSMSFFTNVTNLVIMAYGGYLVISEQMLLSDLVAFFLYVGLFIKPLMRLLAFSEIYQRGMAGYYRFYELMQVQPSIQDRPNAIVCKDIKGGIEFNHVSFGYSDDRMILDDVNLTIKPGEKIAFVGETGAGKTTLANLLLRFYDLVDGSIKLDGVDIRDYRQDSLRKQIGLVQQDVFLFSESVGFNIAYGVDEAGEEQIEEAAREASAHKFISSLPEGYATEIGERGVKLSGGQKQRLALARVFLKNPPVIILDEATSALDNKTEKQIQGALDRLAQGRTTLIIAHRLSTIRNADRIVVLQQGKIAEIGSHEELLEQKGIYYRLYNAI